MAAGKAKQGQKRTHLEQRSAETWNKINAIAIHTFLIFPFFDVKFYPFKFFPSFSLTSRVWKKHTKSFQNGVKTHKTDCSPVRFTVRIRNLNTESWKTSQVWCFGGSGWQNVQQEIFMHPNAQSARVAVISAAIIWWMEFKSFREKAANPRRKKIKSPKRPTTKNVSRKNLVAQFP